MAAAPSAQRIFLTGGRGCLAGVIRQHFTAKGADLTCFSRKAGDGQVALETLLTGSRLAEAETLIHLAWSTVPFSAEQNPGVEWQQDLPLLTRLLTSIAALPERERPHLVFFSSGGTVYGNARDGRPSREGDPCQPIGRHGAAKLAAEQMIEEFSHQHGGISTILRVSNPYGFPVPASRPQGIVPIALKCAREGTPLTVWGDGTARKDFLHHSDFTAALEKIVQDRPGGVFNVCSGESHSIKEIVAIVERTIGRNVVKLHAPAPAWDVHDSLLDNSKLQAAANWRPTIRLAEGIRRAAIELLPA
jgi:UDP-glucose 4-epimerase